MLKRLFTVAKKHFSCKMEAKIYRDGLNGKTETDPGTNQHKIHLGPDHRRYKNAV